MFWFCDNDAGDLVLIVSAWIIQWSILSGLLSVCLGFGDDSLSRTEPRILLAGWEKTFNSKLRKKHQENVPESEHQKFM